MTLYSYSCAKCGEFSEFRDNNDREMCDCGQEVKKLFGGNFKLYGTGFYSTDTAIDNHVNKRT